MVGVLLEAVVGVLLDVKELFYLSADDERESCESRSFRRKGVIERDSCPRRSRLALD
jgi:hypothetical protein